MEVDGIVDVDVSQSASSWTVDVGSVPIKWEGDEPLKVNIKNLVRFIAVPVPTPFAINIANVEYCRGRINPETNRYELKIGLVSGRDLTLEGEAAMSFLSTISENYSTDVDGSKSLKAKFQSKSGS